MADELEKSETKSMYFEEGTCGDEIVFEFVKENKKLYVSRHLLFLASAVMKAMFEHDTKEMQTGVVQIEDHQFNHFREFLLCLDPRTMKKIDNENVLEVAGIADKYLVSPLVEKCQRKMVKMLENIRKRADEKTGINGHPSLVLDCLFILLKGEELNYSDIIVKAVEVTACFSSKLYSHVDPRFHMSKRSGFGSGVNFPPSEQDVDKQKLCCNAFQKVSDTLKYKIIQRRLGICENNSFVK